MKLIRSVLFSILFVCVISYPQQHSSQGVYVPPPRRNLTAAQLSPFADSTTSSTTPPSRRDYVAPSRPYPSTTRRVLPNQSTSHVSFISTSPAPVTQPGSRDYVAPRPGTQLTRQDTFIVPKPQTNATDLIRLSYGEHGPSTSRTPPPVPPKPTTASRGTPPPVPPKPTTASSQRGTTPRSPPITPSTQAPKTRPTIKIPAVLPPGPVSPGGQSPPISPQSGPQKPFSYADVVSGGASSTSGPGTSTQVPGASSTQKPPRVEIATDDELKEFSEAALKRDVNNAARFITMNIQGKTKYGELTEDPAPQPLFTISPEAYDIPTIKKMRVMFDNYVANVSVNEHVTPLEKKEENEFIDAVVATPVMQYARKFLLDKGLLSQDPKEFRDILKRIWFNMYSRGYGKIGSSGFEHVFLSEIKKGEITGLHNWVYFADEEKEHRADYLGYVRKIDLGDKGAVLKYRFKLNNLDKPVNSLFVGTSPEFEMSLYTVCYFIRPDRACPMRLNDKKVTLRAYKIKYRGSEMIGSAYPDI